MLVFVFGQTALTKLKYHSVIIVMFLPFFLLDF